MFTGYDVGTEVQEKSGRVKKKVGDGKWVGRNRHNWEKFFKKDLSDTQRVFHINGDKADDSPKNLVAIEFSRKVYNLKRSKIVWAPEPMNRRRIIVGK